MSFICERCGHRIWGEPYGAGAGLRACYACMFGHYIAGVHPATVAGAVASQARPGTMTREPAKARQLAWTYCVRVTPS